MDVHEGVSRNRQMFFVIGDPGGNCYRDVYVGFSMFFCFVHNKEGIWSNEIMVFSATIRDSVTVFRSFLLSISPRLIPIEVFKCDYSSTYLTIAFRFLSVFISHPPR